MTTLAICWRLGSLKTGNEQAMAGEDTRWKPGQSGNPDGRPAIMKEVRQACQDMSLDGCKVLNEIMHDKEQPGSVRVAAVREVYDRAFGRPEQQHRVSGQVNFAALLAEYTTQRLAKEAEIEVLEGDDQDALPAPNGNGAAEDQ